MANMSESPVSLEDLLRLKRHERPQDEFWNGFERDFQHRRLRALMEGAEPRFQFFSGSMWRRLLIWSPVACGAMATLTFLLGFPAAEMAAGREGGEAAEVAQADPVMEPADAVASSPSLSHSMLAPTVAPRLEVSAVSTTARPRFVMDALATQEETRSFRRVLSSASLSVPMSSGSRYVADPLTAAGRMEAAPAMMRSRSHF